MAFCIVLCLVAIRIPGRDNEIRVLVRASPRPWLASASVRMAGVQRQWADEGRPPLQAGDLWLIWTGVKTSACSCGAAGPGCAVVIKKLYRREAGEVVLVAQDDGLQDLLHSGLQPRRSSWRIKEDKGLRNGCIRICASRDPNSVSGGTLSGQESWAGGGLGQDAAASERQE